jgi:uncharacterized repeat protein (TIGR03843 family)
MVFVPAGGESAGFPNDPFPLLREGIIEQIELIPWGSNYTFATSLRGTDGGVCIGIYKPRRGEAPLRDFPAGTLYKRELATYLLSRHLGWNIVPPTVVRPEGPHGIGSMQLYVQPCADDSSQFDRLRRNHRSDLQRMAIFDLLTNNADRKGGHCLLDVRGHLWGIDHGLTFHHVPKLRTVIWDYCDEPFPEHLLATLIEVRRDPSRTAAIRDDVGTLISEREVDALFARWDHLIATPCYPRLDPYRNVPWPPF